jgi:hypothetical protein
VLSAAIDDGRFATAVPFISILDLEYSPSLRLDILAELRAMNLIVEHLFTDSLDKFAMELKVDLHRRTDSAFA